LEIANKSRTLHILSTLIEVDHVVGSVYFTCLEICTILLKCSKLLTVDLSTRQKKVILFTVLLAIVGLLYQYKIIFGCSRTLSMYMDIKRMTKLVEQKN